MMSAETRVRYGKVPHTLNGAPLGEATWQMEDGEFLLRGEGEHYFHYRKGEGVTVERGPGADAGDESLWLNGSVYSAIASLNGLLPIHASAVAWSGRVFAFTGPAGAGKSTLVAGLGAHGLPMFCDDTLVLDLSDPDRITCLPGHKRLKLTQEAIELTGAAAEERVSPSVDKRYARSAAGEVRAVLPLARLIFLEQGAGPDILPVRGADRLLRLQDDHQTARLFATARQFDRAGLFVHLARLASQIEMARFVRPPDPSRFLEGVALAADYVTSSATSRASERT
jgi:hypothetical protein